MFFLKNHFKDRTEPMSMLYRVNAGRILLDSDQSWIQDENVGGGRIMTIQVLMPALSPTMTEGTLARWLVAEGDNVSSGDVIAEIETDKATMEVEALDDGVIAKIMVSEATENVAVNAVIALMTEEGEEPTEMILQSSRWMAFAGKFFISGSFSVSIFTTR